MAIACSNPCHIPDYYQCRQVDLIAHAEVVMLILFINLSILIEDFVPDGEVILATLIDITVFPQVYYIRGKISILGEIP